MASYVKFELEDGTVVYIESADVPKGSSGLIPGGRGEHPADQTATSFDQSVQAIRKMATSLVEGVRSGFVEQPNEVAISFGIKASAELSDLVVARGGTEANYSVSLRWHHNDKKEEKEEEKKAAKKAGEAE